MIKYFFSQQNFCWGRVRLIFSFCLLWNFSWFIRSVKKTMKKIIFTVLLLIFYSSFLWSSISFHFGFPKIRGTQKNSPSLPFFFELSSVDAPQNVGQNHQGPDQYLALPILPFLDFSFLSFTSILSFTLPLMLSKLLFLDSAEMDESSFFPSSHNSANPKTNKNNNKPHSSPLFSSLLYWLSHPPLCP